MTELAGRRSGGRGGFQSPLIGASVMTFERVCAEENINTVSIPSDRGFCNDLIIGIKHIIHYFLFQSPLIGASVMTPTLKHGVISERYKGFCEHPGKNGCREKQDRVGRAQSPSQPIETKRETHIRASPPSGPDPAGWRVSLFSAGRRDAPRGLLMPVSCPHFLPFSNPS